jgi:hypothetical protein
MDFNINQAVLYDLDCSRSSNKVLTISHNVNEKTEEEMKKLTLEEDLSAVKRAQLILTRG